MDLGEKKADELPTRKEFETNSDVTSLGKSDILGREAVDPVLNAKMHLVNDVCL